jgi:hypothetical protein
VTDESVRGVPQRARVGPDTLSVLRKYHAEFASWLAAPLEPNRYAATTCALNELARVATSEAPAVVDEVHQLWAIQRELSQAVVEATLPSDSRPTASVAGYEQLLDLHRASVDALALACSLTSNPNSP